MNEQEIAAQMRAAVSIATESLTNTDLAGLNICAQLDQDPRTSPWYSKVAHLFTERDGARMHAETKAALARIVMHRLRPAND